MEMVVQDNKFVLVEGRHLGQLSVQAAAEVYFIPTTSVFCMALVAAYVLGWCHRAFAVGYHR